MRPDGPCRLWGLVAWCLAFEPPGVCIEVSQENICSIPNRDTDRAPTIPIHPLESLGAAFFQKLPCEPAMTGKVSLKL